MDEERIPVGRVLVFSAPVLGVFFANALISTYLLKFATDVLLIAPAAMGLILLLSRVWDAVSDPLVGHLSDRTRTRLGRRRPWFVASAVPLAVSIVAVWSPPAGLEGGALLAWVAAACLLYYTCFTTFRVPHLALGAELSRGYHDRTRVFGVMQVVESVGMLLGAGGLFLLERASDPRSTATLLAAAVGLVSAGLIFGSTALLRERAEFQGRGSTSSWRAFRDVIVNPHARLLLVIFFLEQLGFSVLIVLLPYLSDYVLRTPGGTALYLFSALAALIVSVPVWVVISRRFGKKRVWLFSLAAKLVIFGSLYFLGQGDFAALVTASLLFGFMAGCGSVVGPSLKADVVDWDEARTGERKEGAYFATWNFAQKAAAGMAGWMIGSALSLAGFVPNAVQSEPALLSMRLLVSAWPLALHAAALLLVLRFGLDEAAHRAAREQARGLAG